MVNVVRNSGCKQNGILMIGNLGREREHFHPMEFMLDHESKEFFCCCCCIWLKDKVNCIQDYCKHINNQWAKIKNINNKNIINIYICCGIGSLAHTFSIKSIQANKSIPKSMNAQSIPSFLYSSCSNTNMWWLKNCCNFSFVKLMQSCSKPLYYKDPHGLMVWWWWCSGLVDKKGLITTFKFIQQKTITVFYMLGWTVYGEQILKSPRFLMWPIWRRVWGMMRFKVPIGKDMEK